MTSTNCVGPAASSSLKHLLTTCTDPIEAITNFQVSNAVKCPTLAPALKLLDLHGIRRSEYHEVVLLDMRDRLINKIRDLALTLHSGDEKDARKKLNELVIKSFAFVNVPQLRPVVLEALKQLPKLPDQYLKQIKEDDQLYKDVALEVKQQIWLEDESLLLQEISPLIEQYLRSRRHFFVNLTTCQPTFLLESAQTRRSNSHIRRLSSAVTVTASFPSGKPDSFSSSASASVSTAVMSTLMQRLLHRLRILYEASGCPPDAILCALRGDLTSTLRSVDDVAGGSEAGVAATASSVHRFARCVDACIREKHLDPKHAQELKVTLDGAAKKSSDKVLVADLAMIVADPYVMHFLNQLMSKLLNHCMNNDVLPRDSSASQLVLRLLNLGCNAWQIVSNCLNAQSDECSKEPKIDSIIYTKFLSSLIILMCRDQYRLLNLETYEAEDIENEVSEEEKQMFDCQAAEVIVEQFMKSDPLCCRLVMFYVLENLKKRSGQLAANVLSKWLPALARGYGQLAYDQTYLHLLVYHLCAGSVAEHLGSDDEAFDAVFGKFLLKKIEYDAVKFQTAKLAFFIARKLPKIKRDYLLECLQTAKDQRAVGELESRSLQRSESIKDAESLDDLFDESLDDDQIFARMFDAVRYKFDSVERLENEPLTATPALSRVDDSIAQSIASRSFSDEFLDMPAPMTPSF